MWNETILIALDNGTVTDFFHLQNGKLYSQSGNADFNSNNQIF